MQTVQKLYAAGTVSTDAAAAIDVPDNSVIEGILLEGQITGADALNDGAQVEISFASTSGFVSNDTRASIAGAGSRQGFLTSGGSATGWLQYIPMDIPVQAGERLYMHVVVFGTMGFICSAWIYLKGGGAPRRPNFR